MTGSSTTTETDEEHDAGLKTEEAATSPGEESGEAGDDVDSRTGATAEDAEEGPGDEPAETAGRARSSVAVGAGAVVSVGLGLASLTGTWLSDVMSSRQELIGQINSGQSGSPSEQIAAIYGTPWHTTALFNGLFALAAMIVAGAALLLPAFSSTREASPVWVRAVALGGLVLGVLGLLIAAAMWFDVFTELPAVPGA
ncbi:MAG: hypothetical protein ACRDJ9_28750 [Dehalococcoidia bacterium]